MDYYEIRNWYKELYKGKHGKCLSDKEADRKLVRIFRNWKVNKRILNQINNEVQHGTLHILKQKIDQALDNKDEELFYDLTTQLKNERKSIQSSPSYSQENNE